MSNENNTSVQLRDVVGNSILTPKTAEFFKNGDLPALIKTDENNEKKEYKKIFLIRNFPFEYKYDYITVLDENMKEIGILRSVEDFPSEQAEILKNELDRRYYMPKIKEIVKMKEKMGFTNWVVDTDFGQITFSVKDTYKNMVKLPGGRCIITDVDGNRYEIPKLSLLDKKSYKKIELLI